MAAPYTVEDACKLARLIQYGPGVVPENTPTPAPKEAIELIREDRKNCGFNWITATTAIQVLENHLTDHRHRKG